MSSVPIQAPDFVIVGGTMPDGRVMVLASTELDEAELRAVPMHWSLSPIVFADWQPPQVRFLITAAMKRYVVIESTDYPSAMATLFRQWQPSDHPGLPWIELRMAIDRG